MAIEESLDSKDSRRGSGSKITRDLGINESLVYQAFAVMDHAPELIEASLEHVTQVRELQTHGGNRRSEDFQFVNDKLIGVRTFSVIITH